MGLLGEVITTGPGPVSLVHNPVPVTGVFPLRMSELIPQLFTGDWVTEAVVAAAEAVLDCAGSLRNLGGERGAVMLGRVRTGLVAVRVAVMVWASFRPLRKAD